MNKLSIIIYLILTYLNPVTNHNIQLSLNDKEIDKSIANEMAHSVAAN